MLPPDLVMNLHKENDALKAENADLQRKLAEREWQPIETAPKDGTVVLGYTVQNESMEVYFDCYDTMTWMFWNYDNECSPTHWMPLPAAPNQNEK